MTIKIDGQVYELMWASDVHFDGIRLEAWRGETIVMDIACGDGGAITVSTWEKDVPVALVEVCIAKGRKLLTDRDAVTP